jgi:hypothetical protein
MLRYDSIQVLELRIVAVIILSLYMLLYNITIILEEAAEIEWLKWMQETHIPAVMDTGKFVSNRLLKVVDSPNEGVTYCVQYVADTLHDYESYKVEHAPALQEKLELRFKDRHVSFRTLMEYVA